MATLSGEIKFLTSEYRPCVVDGKKALFHKWEHRAEARGVGGYLKGQEEPKTIPLAADFAIVELENGQVKEVEPWKIKFLDSKGLFNEIAFPSMEG